MADLSKTISIIFQGEDRLSGAVGAIEKKFNSVGTEAANASSKVDGLANDLDNVGKKSAGVDAATTALKALAASLVFKAFVDANIEIERFNLAITSVKGSSAAAATEFDYVRDVTKRLGLQLFDTADNYVKLTAATEGTALEGESTRFIFEAVSGAMARLGRSSADTGGALLAISQIVSKGTVSMEELRGQLGERLPGAFQVAARSMGLTTEELGKLVESGKLAATDFLPKFAAALNDTFGAGPIDGFQANLNRLKNTLDEAFITIGNAGAFDALIGGLKLGTATVVGAVASFTLLGEIVAAVFMKLTNPRAFDFGAAVSESMDKAANTTRQAGDEVRKMAGLLDDVKPAGTNAGEAIRTGFSDARFEAGRLKEGTKEVDVALKTLGLDPKKFQADIDKIMAAFKTLTSDPSITGDTILAGLKKTLNQLANEKQINQVIEDLAQAFTEGRLSSNQYVDAIELARKKILNLGDAFPGTTKLAKEQADQLKKNEQAAEKAREAAEKYKLEMEKLASNERIKLIEAKVALNIANVEANAKIAIAAFESVNTTINSTGDLLAGLFKLFDNDKLDFTQLADVRQQIELENRRRDEALILQKRLVEAQINQILAQTKALDKGDALIKIDGAGLQPHLEAFMFEILRTIQTRVNAQGLDLLLGIPIV